jgi:hypothetical protein
MPPLTEAEIVDGSRQLTEDADVITGALEARKQAADRMREYAHQTADQAIAIARSARARAEEAAKRAATNRVDAEVAYRRAREEVENARVLSDRHEGHAVPEKKDEWKQCRVTIDRFDKLLVELGDNATFLLQSASAAGSPDFPLAAHLRERALIGEWASSSARHLDDRDAAAVVSHRLVSVGRA